MNKNMIAAAVIAGSMIVTPLFAADNFLKTFLLNKHVAMNADELPELNKTTSHADFSGDWMGTCDMYGENFPVNIKLKNDGRYFLINDMMYEIGSLETTTDANHLRTSSDNMALEWSEDLSTLIVKHVGFLRHYPSYPFNAAVPIQTFMSKSSFSIVNDKLVVKGESLVMQDMTEDQKDKFSCSFNKQ